MTDTDERMMLKQFEHARVLVVDDNEASVLLLKATLSRAGLSSIHAVTDSSLASEQFKELRPDLVLLDLHMPGLDGYEVLTQLMEIDRELPVLVLTADTTREATHRALRLGASDFLTKPVDTVEVTLRVRTLLQTRALRDTLRQRQRWLEASGEVARALIAGTGDDAARVIATRAQDVAGADLAAAALPTRGGGELSIVTSVALDLDGHDLQEVARSIAFSLSQPVIKTGKPLVIDFSSREHDALRVDGLRDVGPVMIVPLMGSRGIHGALCLGRGLDRRPFTPTELELCIEFGHQAALGMELAQDRAEREQATVLHAVR